MKTYLFILFISCRYSSEWIHLMYHSLNINHSDMVVLFIVLMSKGIVYFLYISWSFGYLLWSNTSLSLLTIKNSLYILDMNPLSEMLFANIFFSFGWLTFCFVVGFFCCAEAFVVWYCLFHLFLHVISLFLRLNYKVLFKTKVYKFHIHVFFYIFYFYFLLF